jgi:hypothetical protein
VRGNHSLCTHCVAVLVGVVLILWSRSEDLGGGGGLESIFGRSFCVDGGSYYEECCANYNYSQVHESFCNIVLCKCEVDPTGNCVVKINLYSN